MSATAFLKEHAPGADFRSFMAKKHEAMLGRPRPHSIIGALGEAMAQAGTAGLRANSDDTTREFGALLTGVSVMAAERMIFDAYFDRQEFIDDLNVRLGSCGFGGFAFSDPEKRIEAISVGDHNQMIEFATRHPTLTEFFLDRDLLYLPPTFSSTLLLSEHPQTGRDFFSYMIDVLPEYFELANALIQPKEQEKLPPEFHRTVTFKPRSTFVIDVRNWAQRTLGPLKYSPLKTA